MFRSVFKCVAMSVVICSDAVASETQTGSEVEPSAQSAVVDAQHTYALQHIGVALSPNRWTAYQGNPQNSLEGVDFYKAIGRQDLVDAYQSRSQTKTTLEVIGSAVFAIGLVYAVVSFESQGPCKVSTPTMHYGDCWDQQLAHDRIPQGVVGAGVAAAGAGLLVWGILLNPHPVDPAQARQLAERYNEDLKKRLGVSQAEGSKTVQSTKAHLTLTPVPNRSGGGLALGISF